MKETEKKQLKAIADRLLEVSDSGWTSGDLEQWASYGKKMESAILTVVPILKALAEDTDNIDGITSNPDLKARVSILSNELTKEDLIEILKRTGI